MDQAAILDHQFRVAAYVITWVIQLAYLAWLGLRWQSQKRLADRILPESSDFQEAYAKGQKHVAWTTLDAEAIAAKSDGELLGVLALLGNRPPEITKEARAQLRERGVLVGVGGWLRFLCVYLTILVPIGVALNIVAFSIGFFQDHGYWPSIGDGELGFPLLLYLFVAFFTIVAGAGLWTERRKSAVSVAKLFFISTIIVSVLRPFVSYFTWNDPFYSRPTIDSMALPTIISVLLTVFWAVIWIRYLGNSERVRNTYLR